MERSQSGASPEARDLSRGDPQEDPAIAELRASEARLRAAERMAQLGHWDRDYVAHGIRLSDEAYRILGVPVGQRRDDLAECERMFMEAIHPDDRARVLQAARDALAGGPPYNVEYRVVRLDGEMRVLASRGTVTRDEHGRPLRFLGYFQDITELRRLEAQFLQAQKMEAVGQLAGGVAHDFNNLLTVINGCTELLLGSVQEPSNLELLGEIRSCGARAAGLTRQLLAFSHKQVLQPLVFDVNASLQGLLSLLRRLLGAHIDIQLALAPTAVCAKVDPGQLEQALLNLAINARDAMPDGGQLVIQTAHAERFVVITVRDTGCGMPQATCARIFEPFFTTKGPGGGTGLGLAMVHGFVVQAGGRIEVESTSGAGTTFRICLPRAEAKQDDD